MKLSKNGRKIQRAIQRALKLGLPVAGLLAMVGCKPEASCAAMPGTKVEERRALQGMVKPKDSCELNDSKFKCD